MYQAGKDMFFPIFSPSNILLEMKNSSESRSLAKSMVHVNLRNTIFNYSST